MSTVKRVSVTEQAEKQGLVVEEGQMLLRYSTIRAMSDATKMLANKALPTKESRIHVARCARILKDVIDEEYTPERQRIQEHYRPVEGSVIEDGESVKFRDPIGMGLELAALDNMVTAIKLPSRITDAMLPVNSKASPNNEDGLAAILADLGVLFPIEE